MSSLCDIILDAKEMKEKAMKRGRILDCEIAKKVISLIETAMEKGDTSIHVSAINLRVNVKEEFKEAMEKKGFQVEFRPAGEYKITWE